VVLKRLDLNKMAVDVLVQAVTKQPLHWGAWQELASLLADREMVILFLFYFIFLLFAVFSFIRTLSMLLCYLA
jgi:hypothetical protein